VPIAAVFSSKGVELRARSKPNTKKSKLAVHGILKLFIGPQCQWEDEFRLKYEICSHSLTRY
jgi:hypothetical protein